MRWLLQWSFGCRHANTSFPQTVPSRRRHSAVAAPPQPAQQRRGLGTPAGGGHRNVGGHSNVGVGGGHSNVGAGDDHPNVGARRGHPSVDAESGHSNVGASGDHPNVGAGCAKVTYVTCLRCGQEFNYCWRTMQRLSSAPNWAPTWIEEQMTGTCSSRALREIEELRHLWMT